MRCFWCVQQSEVWSIKINALHSEIFHLNRHERHISSPTVQSCIKMLPVLSSCRLKYPIKCCKPLCCFSSFLLFHNTLNQYLFQLNVPRKKKSALRAYFFLLMNQNILSLSHQEQPSSSYLRQTCFVNTTF